MRRYTSKDQVTKTLGEVSISNVENFLNSLENVDLFAKKILALLGNDTGRIRDLVNHSRKGTTYKADQNYYFLWLLLKEIPMEYIMNNQERVFEEIRKVFSIIQKTPQDLAAIDFVKKMSDFGSITGYDRNNV